MITAVDIHVAGFEFTAREVEIPLPYGSAVFASKVGQLASNHFATVEDGLERLPDLGKLVLWQGAQDILFQQREP